MKISQVIKILVLICALVLQVFFPQKIKESYSNCKQDCKKVAFFLFTIVSKNIFKSLIRILIMDLYYNVGVLYLVNTILLINIIEHIQNKFLYFTRFSFVIRNLMWWCVLYWKRNILHKKKHSYINLNYTLCRISIRNYIYI